MKKTQTIKSAAKVADLNSNLLKIKFLLNPAGKFLLPYNVGQEVELPENIAIEIVDSKYAEFIETKQEEITE
jgi:hypothetical protein